MKRSPISSYSGREMHELAVTQRILEIALQHAGQAGARRVTDLYLVVGQLATVLDDSVQFYWDAISGGTIAEGAMLHFRRVPAEMACRACGLRYALPPEGCRCPACGSEEAWLVAGEELRLEAIDVEREG